MSREAPQLCLPRHWCALIANCSREHRSPRQRPPPLPPPARATVQRSGMATSAAVACQAAAVGAQRVAQWRAHRAAAVPAAAPCRRRQQQRRLAVAATAAPPATASPFAAVQNEEQLFGLLKAGASSGTVGACGAGSGPCPGAGAGHMLAAWALPVSDTCCSASSASRLPGLPVHSKVNPNVGAGASPHHRRIQRAVCQLQGAAAGRSGVLGRHLHMRRRHPPSLPPWAATPAGVCCAHASASAHPTAVSTSCVIVIHPLAFLHTGCHPGGRRPGRISRLCRPRHGQRERPLLTFDCSIKLAAGAAWS